MKSIVEEASSITQAIQNAWERAGKPQEFSIKIFEESEKSFFGMRTLKSAKIGLFFKEDTFLLGIPKKQPATRPEKKLRTQQEKRNHKTTFLKDRKAEQQDRFNKKTSSPRPMHDYAKPSTNKPDKRKDTLLSKQPLLEKNKHNKRPVWTDEMVNDVQQWIQQSLSLIAMSNINFTANVSRNHLRLQFEKSITGDEKKERMLYSSFANLIMASLRNKFKREFRNLRVVISH